jgi:hypothetical protein
VQQRLAVPVLVRRQSQLDQHGDLVRGRRRLLGLRDCSGQAGVLGASNPNGIPTDYITQFKATYVSPLINGADPGIPTFRSKTNIATNSFDMVYVPYCTGDVHLGNRVVTYTDPAGQPPITFRHNGYNNSIAIMNVLRGRFPTINTLVITGFSAGGVASSAVFYQARRTLLPTRAHMLNDSGPVFPAPNATYNSRPLHDLIKAQWNLQSLYNQLPASFNQNDFGSINAMVATEFPNDRLAYVGYSSDYNFSRFSYERFYPGITQAGVLQKWRADQTNLINQIKNYSNYSYHVPWHRPINDSYCTSIITFIGSHACPTVRKKYWYEIPIGQTWKCPSGNMPFETFLTPLHHQQSADPYGRARELLQQRGPGHVDRRAADQRRDLRLIPARAGESGIHPGSPVAGRACATQ